MRKVIKLIKNNILGFIIGAVIFTGVGVSAATYLYSSNQISYSNSNSSATDVKGALDELYNLQNSGAKYNIVKLGGAGTYDLTTYEGYESFELNKNIFVVTSAINMSASVSTHDTSGGVSGSGSGSRNLYSATYNNGTLVVNNGSGSISGTLRDSYENVGSVTGSFSVSSISVYLIY